MKAHFLAGAGLDRMLEPTSAWSASTAQDIALQATPLGMQPTAAIRASWQDRPYGAVRSVRAAALHDGVHLVFRLQWDDAQPDTNAGDGSVFADAAAVLLPSVAGAALITMGGPGAPVTAWYWRADEGERGRHVVAQGIGSSRTIDQDTVQARARWQDGAWTVTLGRALQVRSDEPVAQLSPGQSVPFAVSVWEGSGGERAGIKSFSAQDLVLEIERSDGKRG